MKPEETVEPADDPVKLVQQKPTGPHRDPVKPAKKVPPAPKTLLDAVKGGTFNQIKQFVDGRAETGIGDSGRKSTHYLDRNEKLSIKEMGEAWILLGGKEEDKDFFLEMVKDRRGDGDDSSVAPSKPDDAGDDAGDDSGDDESKDDEDDSSVPALKTLFDAAGYGALNQIKQFVEDGADIEAYDWRGYQPLEYLVGNLVLTMKEMGEAYILLGGKEADKDNFLENARLERNEASGFE